MTTATAQIKAQTASTKPARKVRTWPSLAYLESCHAEAHVQSN